jgi:hypothetical protein
VPAAGRQALGAEVDAGGAHQRGGEGAGADGAGRGEQQAEIRLAGGFQAGGDGGGPTGNGGSYFGTAGTTFSILNAQPADSAQYRCALGNSNCGPTPSLFSVAVPMTIAAAAPTVTGPGNSYQCTGDNDAYMSVTTSPAAGCQFRWQKRIGPSANSFADIFDGPTGNGVLPTEPHVQDTCVHRLSGRYSGPLHLPLLLTQGAIEHVYGVSAGKNLVRTYVC